MQQFASEHFRSAMQSGNAEQVTKTAGQLKGPAGVSLLTKALDRFADNDSVITIVANALGEFEDRASNALPQLRNALEQFKQRDLRQAGPADLFGDLAVPAHLHSEDAGYNVYPESDLLTETPDEQGQELDGWYEEVRSTEVTPDHGSRAWIEQARDELAVEMDYTHEESAFPADDLLIETPSEPDESLYCQEAGGNQDDTFPYLDSSELREPESEYEITPLSPENVGHRDSEVVLALRAAIKKISPTWVEPIPEEKVDMPPEGRIGKFFG